LPLRDLSWRAGAAGGGGGGLVVAVLMGHSFYPARTSALKVDDKEVATSHSPCKATRKFKSPMRTQDLVRYRESTAWVAEDHERSG